MDYGELVVSVGNEMRYGAIAHDASRLVQAAENYLRHEMRLSDSETDTVINVDTVNGFTRNTFILPTNIGHIRLVKDARGNINHLTQQAVEIENRRGYFIEGSTNISWPRLLITSTGISSITVYYHSDLPSIETSGSNWLSIARPELYKAALKFQALAHQALRDPSASEKAVQHKVYLDDMINEVVDEDIGDRFVNKSVMPKGYRP